MSSVPPSPQQDIPNWTDPAVPRLDPERPYLRIGHATVFVRDQDRSLHFYRDRLGFSLVADLILATGIRWLAVAPPNGTAILEIVAPAPGSEEYALVGRTKRLTLITEDVDSLYEQWSERGVVFRHPPRPAEWGGIFTQLYDPDGNATTLVSIDSVTKKLDEERQAAAARQEAERRSLQEMEIARQVQTRLFPQALPRSSTLDFAGSCVQSRAVGGDYYDFLDFGDDRLGLVIGDVAGKGIAAALLMVSLQATLRSQIGKERFGLPEVLRIVNEHFHANSPDSAYATLFLAEYDGASQVLRYVNCGHLCGLLFGADGTVRRLEPTATVVGMFPKWEGQTAECRLQPADVLVLYTDGVTESPGPGDEDYGEARLLASIHRHRGHGAQRMLELLMRDLRGFSTEEQHDDITLIVAKGLAPRLE